MGGNGGVSLLRAMEGTAITKAFATLFAVIKECLAGIVVLISRWKINNYKKG